MSTNSTLDAHADEMGGTLGLVVEVLQEGNQLFVVIKRYRLPVGLARVETTDILFITDAQYPFSAMDMFWTEVGVVRPDGSTFENSDSIQEFLDRQWRRYSYHRHGTWSPTGNPLLHHFAFMESRWTGRARR